MNKRFYRFLLPLVRVFLRLVYRVRVSGAEHVPSEGGFVLSSNHVHALDPFMLAICCPKRHMRFLAKAELFENRIVRGLIKSIGAVPIRRGETDLGAVRELLKLLSEGHALGIFPQGTRSRDNDRTHMETGVALIALRAGKGVVPAFIDGPYRLFRRTRVVFGPMITFDDLGRRFDRDTLQRATGRIEEAIWALRLEKK